MSNMAGNKAGEMRGNIAGRVPKWIGEVRKVSKKVNADLDKKLAKAGGTAKPKKAKKKRKTTTRKKKSE